MTNQIQFILITELPQQSATQQPTYVNMSELANMAALKITNNCSSVPQPPEKPERHNIPPKPPQQQPPLQHQQSTDSHSSLSSSHISSPEHSKTLSLASHDSAAGTPTGGPTTTCASTDISTPTNNEDDFDKTTTTENTNEILGGGDGSSDENNILKITETDSTSITNTSTQSNCTPTPSTTNTSPTTPSVEKEDPIVTRGSVLQKTSMFEKAAASKSVVENIYGVRKEEKVAADTKDSNGEWGVFGFCSLLFLILCEKFLRSLIGVGGRVEDLSRSLFGKTGLYKFSTGLID